MNFNNEKPIKNHQKKIFKEIKPDLKKNPSTLLTKRAYKELALSKNNLPIENNEIDQSIISEINKIKNIDFKLSKPILKYDDNEDCLEIQELKKKFQKLILGNILFFKNENVESTVLKIIHHSFKKIKLNQLSLPINHLNIFYLINLQIPLNNNQFQNLSFNLKLKTIILIFVKYVKISLLQNILSEYMPEIDLLNINQLQQLIFKDQISDLDDSLKLKFSKIFKISNRKRKVKQELNFKLINDLLKKILIYLICLINISENFIKCKINSSHIDESISDLIHQCHVKKSKDIILKIDDKFPIPERLISMNIEQLVDEVKIEAVQNYLLMIHVYIPHKKWIVDIPINIEGQITQINLSNIEQEIILCGKLKRRDEYIKLGFKFVRRHLLKNFAKKKKIKFNLQNSERIKELFNNQFFGNDKQAISFFESFDLTKKNIYLIKRHPELLNNFESFINESFLYSFVIDYIFKKDNLVMHKTTTLFNFLKEILSRQHKHSIMFFDILNCFQALKDFLSFS